MKRGLHTCAGRNCRTSPKKTGWTGTFHRLIMVAAIKIITINHQHPDTSSGHDGITNIITISSSSSTSYTPNWSSNTLRTWTSLGWKNYSSQLRTKVKYWNDFLSASILGALSACFITPWFANMFQCPRLLWPRCRPVFQAGRSPCFPTCHLIPLMPVLKSGTSFQDPRDTAFI